MNEKEPLAFRMRPKTLEEYVGQEHVIGPGKLLYRTIKADEQEAMKALTDAISGGLGE